MDPLRILAVDPQSRPTERRAGSPMTLNPFASPTRTTPLSELPGGSRGVVAGVAGGRALAGRLAAMGLTAGVEIQVLQNRGRGPVLALVRDTRIALGRVQAGMVVVHDSRIEEPPVSVAAG